MAEAIGAIGAAASIVTLLSLASQTIKCVKSWTTVDGNAQRLARELADLQNLLETLNNLTHERPEDLSNILHLTEPGATFDQLQKILNTLLQRLDGYQSSSQTGQRNETAAMAF